ncbi:hypothetical protein F2P44_12090 [Massilia sp. CCM 8695]|uniref:SMP-30/Gluconolactonase/LRE-like region domain-containing protein n=2 Tax=Massilia frigida TaxID=2609281 RepID=A0ABX0N3V7_9BURK|nr:hypothetical protein [Massilia frigida]
MVRADGIRQDARFEAIADAEIDSKGTLYISDQKRDNTGGYYFFGYAIRSVGRDGTVRTVYTHSFDNNPGATLIPGDPRVSIDARDQVFFTNLSQTYLLGQDGMATPLPFGQGGERVVTSAAGISYRITYSTISRIEADGSVTLLAGADITIPLASGAIPLASGDPAFPGPVDGPGRTARFKFIRPETVVLDPAGNLYLADASMLRKVTPQGVVSTLAGADDTAAARDGTGSAARFTEPAGMAYKGGLLLVIDNGVLRRVSLAGVVTTSTTTLPNARVLRADRDGTVYVVFPDHIATLGDDGQVTLFAGKPNLSETSVDGIGAAARLRGPQWLTADPSGNLYAIERQTLGYRSTGPYINSGVNLRKIAPDGSVTSRFLAAGLPSGIAADKAGNVYVSTHWYNSVNPGAARAGRAIHKLGPDGTWTVFAGLDAGPDEKTDGTGAAARFSAPRILGFDKAGDLYVEDAGPVIRRITPAALVTTVASAPAEVGQVLDDAGNRYAADTAHSTILKIVPSGASSIVAGTPDRAATVPGPLPGAVEYPKGLVRIGINSYAFISGNAIVRLALP